MKVPHKAKKYEQQFFRTMFFHKADTVIIDGNSYDISNVVKVECWNHKEFFVVDLLESFEKESSLEPETFLEDKKKFIARLKDFDKNYMKHSKKTHPEVHNIIYSALNPLLELLESNYNFYRLEEMIKKGQDIPSFRYHALEDKFCEHLETICTILKEHGRLIDTFSIKRMLNLLKIDNWENIVPMAFFLDPLKASIKKSRDELLFMRKKGPNQCKYNIEDNEEMHDYIIQMVKDDVNAQWLMGDTLKREQLCFLYEVIKIIYDSSLKTKLKNREKTVILDVIPKLACFRALIAIKDILNTKIEEKKKNKELGIVEPDEDQSKVEQEEEKKEISPKKQLTEEQEKMIAEKERKLKEEAEINKYGRQWIWQTYISETIKESWMEAAEILRHVNDHVLLDIQDYILIQGFGQKLLKDRKAIDGIVEGLLGEHEKNKAENNPEMIKEIIKKRKFEMQHRPPFVWNFFETRADIEEKTKKQNVIQDKEQEPDVEEGKEEQPYLINAFADPEKCYSMEEKIHENRIKKLMKHLETLSYNLQHHEEAMWNKLTDKCIEIFKY